MLHLQNILQAGPERWHKHFFPEHAPVAVQKHLINESESKRKATGWRVFFHGTFSTQNSDLQGDAMSFKAAHHKHA